MGNKIFSGKSDRGKRPVSSALAPPSSQKTLSSQTINNIINNDKESKFQPVITISGEQESKDTEETEDMIAAKKLREEVAKILEDKYDIKPSQQPGKSRIIELVPHQHTLFCERKERVCGSVGKFMEFEFLKVCILVRSILHNLPVNVTYLL